MCAVFIIYGYMQQAIQLLYKFQLVATLLLQRLLETIQVRQQSCSWMFSLIMITDCDTKGVVF